MYKRAFFGLIMLLGSGLINSGYSQQPDRDRWDWVVSGFIGAVHTHSSELIISQPSRGTNLTFDTVGFRGRSFEGPLYYGYRGGVFLKSVPAVGLEAEFIHLKAYADTGHRVRASGTHLGVAVNGEINVNDVVQRYSISHGVNLMLFNVAGRRRLQVTGERPHGRFIVAARAGAGFTIPHTESVIDGISQEQYEVGRFAFQMAGSAEAQMWKGLYLLGEYKFTRTRQNGKIFAGQAESLLRTHHGVFGLSYHF